jgi:hypothetical protein
MFVARRVGIGIVTPGFEARNPGNIRIQQYVCSAMRVG